MIKLFCSCLIIVFAGGTFTISNERAAQLADEFETEMPGSVDWLYRWAMDELIIDELNAVVDGRLNITTSSKSRPESIAFFLFFRNPEIEILEFTASMTRVFGAHISSQTLASQYFTIRSTSTVPNWFLGMLSQGRASNMSKPLLVTLVFQQVAHMRSTGQINPRDFRFGTSEKRLRGLIYIWLRFGLPSRFDESPPAIFNPATKEWTLSAENQREVFRRLAILGTEE